MCECVIGISYWKFAKCKINGGTRDGHGHKRRIQLVRVQTSSSHAAGAAPLLIFLTMPNLSVMSAAYASIRESRFLKTWDCSASLLAGGGEGGGVNGLDCHRAVH